MPTVTYTPLTESTGTAEFPPGWSDGYDVPGNLWRHVFDFTRRRGYEVIFGGASIGGLNVIDLDALSSIALVSFNSMYAGTSFGTPWGQTGEVSAGNGANIYLSLAMTGASPSITRNRLVRVDPASWKVTGEFYLGATATGCVYNAHFGVVNQMAGSVDVVAYLDNNYTLQVFNGATMAYLGNSTNVMRWTDGSGTFAVPGARNTDGSCDFWIVSANTGSGTPVGAIDMFRVRVSPSGAIATTLSGTVNGLAIWPGSAVVFAQRADWDAQHGRLILWVGGGADWPGARGAAAAVVAVTQTGAIVWRYDITRYTAPSLGSAALAAPLCVLRDGNTLVALNAADGTVVETYDIILPGGVPAAEEHYYSVFSSSHTDLRISFYSFSPAVANYALAGTLPPDSGGGGVVTQLAMDNVVATATQTLLSTNLVSLRWSDDRGHSYGSPVSQSIGEAGEYRTSLQWQRLAYARDRVFEISWSVPMRTALQGCWVDVTPAQS